MAVAVLTERAGAGNGPSRLPLAVLEEPREWDERCGFLESRNETLETRVRSLIARVAFLTGQRATGGAVAGVGTEVCALRSGGVDARDAILPGSAGPASGPAFAGPGASAPAPSVCASLLTGGGGGERLAFADGARGCVLPPGDVCARGDGGRCVWGCGHRCPRCRCPCCSHGESMGRPAQAHG